MRKKPAAISPIMLPELERELKRVRERTRYRQVLVSTVSALITVAAAAILLATMWFPVLQIWGSSMTPTLHEGEIVVSLKGSRFETGDVIAFYYNNKILVKRVIAGPGQWVDIREGGQVFVDDRPLDEPYVSEPALGDCNIALPYQVPDGRYFVMGDHRTTSVDSRNTAVGCVAREQVVGKIVLCIWPLKDFGEIPRPDREELEKWKNTDSGRNVYSPPDSADT